MKTAPTFILASVFLASAAGSWLAAPAPVQLRVTNDIIPTYGVAPADLNPRFYQGRTYQGARANFYPYPVSDRLTDERSDKLYQVLTLENQYVQFSVLPELGGRIFAAVDKGNGYDFFYRQHVIKPALIGMLGAWISGGVEWNVPHHHRASSFMPVDYTTEAQADGAQTIWVGETEWRHRMQWRVGLTLRPGRSYLEMTVQMANRTPVANSFLFWINPAVHANDRYQVIFPPDAEFAVQHAKPEFARWPISREFYGGTDYTKGVDISWWKNHPSPVSFFCFHSDEDFFGGYDHGKQAGVLHVANHHVVPGKKFFEWGVGAEGERWSRILTDADGPYLELMAGAYSDNQPDYSWLQPGEVKTWKHYWYPVRNLGGVKQANVEAALNLEVTNRTVTLAFNTTAAFPDARARLQVGDKLLLDRPIAIDPAQPFATTLLLEQDIPVEKLRASLVAADGRELIHYQAAPKPEAKLPAPVKRPEPPKDIKSSEALYLTGLRVEQLYSPSFEAAPYYEEAIRRDAGDYRANVALGILLAKQWRWAEAEARLRAAIDRATENYIRPKDGEAFYYLGVVLKAQGRSAEARDAFYQAIWSQAWKCAGHLALAQLATAARQTHDALEQLDASLAAGAFNPQARQLKGALLRQQGRLDAAEQLAQATVAFDPLDLPARWELVRVAAAKGDAPKSAAALEAFSAISRGDVQAFLEIATDYANAGLDDEAVILLQRYLEIAPQKDRVHPMVLYALAHYSDQLGRATEAAAYGMQAAAMPSDYCFPYRGEEEAILRGAMRRNPKDARAPYYLGNLLYDPQPAAAIQAWETARKLDDAFALVHRNLGLAYAQAEKDPAKAITSYERSLALNPNDPRCLFELDVQYEAAGTAVAKRLDLFRQHEATVAQRDDATARAIGVFTVAGQADRAVELVTTRRFHNWEGSRDIHSVYVDALVRRGRARLEAKQFAEAIKDLAAALEYPANLEVGQPRRESRAPQVQYFLGLAHEAAGDQAQAEALWKQAAEGKEGGASEVEYYHGLALRKLGRTAEAKKIFDGLMKAGEDRLKGAEPADYFAKFGERQSERVRKAQAHYLAALGFDGLGRRSEANTHLKEAVALNPGHLGATLLLATENR